MAKGYIRTFADEAAPMMALIRRALEAAQRGSAAPKGSLRYLRALLVAGDFVQGSGSSSPGPQ
ncbi:MAG: hypothetical protein C4332_06585 [Meiothermus sp.]